MFTAKMQTRGGGVFGRRLNKKKGENTIAVQHQ
jgi:hypothetical protein